MLNERIKRYIDEKGIKYSRISEKTGIPMNILSPMLNGKRRIETTEYFRICDALGVALDEFKETEKKGA